MASKNAAGSVLKFVKNIAATQQVDTFIRNGETITLELATVVGGRPDQGTWNRPSWMYPQNAKALKDNVEKHPELIPERTKRAVLRESKHTSPGDPRHHITVVCFDENGVGTTVHIPTGE